MKIHYSFMAEAYLGNHDLLLALKQLFDAELPSWSIIVEADLPPVRRWQDLLELADWLERNEINFLLDGLHYTNPKRKGPPALLSPAQLAQLRAAAPTRWLGLRVYTPLDLALSAPSLFYDAFDYCNHEKLEVQVVLHRHAFFAEGWRETIQRYKTPRWGLLHEGMEGFYLCEDLADYLADFAKEEGLKRWGHSFVAHKAEERMEIARLDVATWLDVQLEAGANLFHFVPLYSFVTGPHFKPLHADLHAWPRLNVKALYKPGTELRFTPLGRVLAEGARKSR